MLTGLCSRLGISHLLLISINVDAWASPKTPPSKRHCCWLQHPVRLQPFLHVVVARHGHEFAILLAYVPLYGVRSDFGHLPINHRRKFINNYWIRELKQTARHIDTEFLPVTQHTVGTEPGGNGVKPHA